MINYNPNYKNYGDSDENTINYRSKLEELLTSKGIDPGSIRPNDYQKLYENQQFIDKFGLEIYNQLRDNKAYRDSMFREAMTNEFLDESFKPKLPEEYSKKNRFNYNNNGYITGIKGLPEGVPWANIDEKLTPLIPVMNNYNNQLDLYNKVMSLTPEGKEELANSGYMTEDQMKTRWGGMEDAQKYLEEVTKNNIFMDSDDKEAALTSKDKLEKEKQLAYNHNNKLLESIYSKDIERKGDLVKEVSNNYYNEYLKLDEQALNRAFVNLINPENGAKNLFSAYFDKNGNSTSEETKEFSKQDKAMLLAKARAFEENYDSGTTYNMLSDYAQKYINEHQSVGRYISLLSKDIMISAATYTASKWNSIRKMALIGQTADVYMDSQGNVYPGKDIEVYEGSNGTHFYARNKDGYAVSVAKVNMSKIALDDLGYDSNGNKRSLFNNAQLLSKAELYGTLNTEDIEYYDTLGFSPNKVVYKPGDETDLFYETAKMSAFQIADIFSELIPGITAAKLAGSAGRVANIVGKAASLWSRVINPVSSAFGIGNDYGRNVFDEAYNSNINKINERFEYEHYQEAADYAFSRVQNDKDIREGILKATEEEFNRYKQRTEANNTPIEDEKTLKEEIRSAVANRVMQQLVDERLAWEKEYSPADHPEYIKDMQQAAESASNAALTASLTTGLKYVGVNLWGYRQYLFKNSKRMLDSSKKKLLEGVYEDGSKKLNYTRLLTNAKNQILHAGKIAGTQFLGGSWTNFTDEMQSAGAKKINESAFDKYMNGYYDGMSEGTVYGAMDNVLSSFADYFSAASRNTFEENTWKAGFVGGLGSIAPSPTINVEGIVEAFTKDSNFKKLWRDASKRGKVGALANMLFKNGILSEYYADKLSDIEMANAIEKANAVIENKELIENIGALKNLDIAKADASDENDDNLINLLRSVGVVNLMDSYKDDPTLFNILGKSSVFNDFQETVDKFTDPSKISAEEMEDIAKEYYVRNPSELVDKSKPEYLDNVKEVLKQNADAIKDAQKKIEEADKEIAKVEKKRGQSISDESRGAIRTQYALSKYYDSKIQDLEKLITGSEDVVSSDNSHINSVKSYGTKKAIQTRIKTINTELDSINNDAEFNEYESKTIDQYNEANSALNNALKDKTIAKDTAEKLYEDYENAKAEVDNLNIRREFRDERIRRLTEERDRLQDSLSNLDSMEILTANEIINSLTPEDRARMLDSKNEALYSKKQINEIKKARDILGTARLEAVKSVSNLVSRQRVNKRVLSNLLEHPEAAARAITANNFQAKRTTTSTVRAIKLDNISRVLKRNIKKGADRKSILSTLKKVDPSYLSYLFDDASLSDIYDTISDCVDLWDAHLAASSVTATSNLISAEERQAAVDDESKKALNIGLRNRRAEVQSKLDTLFKEAQSKDEYLEKLQEESENEDNPILTRRLFKRIIEEYRQVEAQENATVKPSEEESKKSGEEKSKEEREKREEIQKGLTEKEGTPVVETNDTEGKPAIDEKAPTGTPTIEDSSEEGKPAINDDASSGKPAIEDDSKEGTPAVEKENTPTGNPAITDDSKEGTPAIEDNVPDAIPDEESFHKVNIPLSDDADEAIKETPEAKKFDNKSADTEPTPDNDDTKSKSNIITKGLSFIHFLGNTFYRYVVEPLNKEGKLVLRVGNRGNNDLYNRLFKFLVDKDIHLYDIIDNELYQIAQTNPEVHLCMHRSEVNEVLFLAVPYTDKVKRIHNEESGGVIESNGKQYLLIGTMGYPMGNKDAQTAHRSHLQETRTNKDSYFKSNSNSTDEFYVDDTYTSIQKINPGSKVYAFPNQETTNHRVSELLEDRRANPYGFSLSSLKWAVQIGGEFVTINCTEAEQAKIYQINAVNRRDGGTFLLAPSGDGHFIPLYINPVQLRELQAPNHDGGSLYTIIDGILRNMANATSAGDRVKYISDLSHYVYLTGDPTKKNSNTILAYGDTITVVINGARTSFKIAGEDAELTKEKFIDFVKNSPFRINIKPSTLANSTLLKYYDEAGVLTTDAAKIGAANIAYFVNPIENGKPKEVEVPQARSPRKDQNYNIRTQGNLEYIDGAEYRKDPNSGKWYDVDNKEITSPNILQMLEYASLITTRNLDVAKKEHGLNYYVIDNNQDNPIVVTRNSRGIISELSTEEAIEFIKNLDKINISEERKANADKAVEEDKRSATQAPIATTPSTDRADTDDTNVGNIDNDKLMKDINTPTEERMKQDEDKDRLLPNVERAEKIVGQIQADGASLQLVEEFIEGGKKISYYVDEQGNKYMRVSDLKSAHPQWKSFGNKTRQQVKSEDPGPFYKVSTNIGTGFDELGRDVYDDSNAEGSHDSLGDRYPNSNNEDLEEYAEQMAEFKKRLENGDIIKGKKLHLVTRDIKVAGEVEAMFGKEKRIIRVAGTLDILAYDEDGKFYIFDMKTRRTTEPNKAKRREVSVYPNTDSEWKIQLALYKALVESKYNVVVEGCYILPTTVYYETPDGTHVSYDTTYPDLAKTSDPRRCQLTETKNGVEIQVTDTAPSLSKEIDYTRSVSRVNMGEFDISTFFGYEQERFVSNKPEVSDNTTDEHSVVVEREETSNSVNARGNDRMSEAALREHNSSSETIVDKIFNDVNLRGRLVNILKSKGKRGKKADIPALLVELGVPPEYLTSKSAEDIIDYLERCK